VSKQRQVRYVNKSKTTNTEEEYTPMYRGGWESGEVQDMREKRRTNQDNIAKSNKHMKRKSTGILARQQDIFVLFPKW